MPRKSMDGVRVHLILTKPQYRKVTEHADKHSLPMSEVLRRAVDMYLNSVEEGRK